CTNDSVSSVSTISTNSSGLDLVRLQVESDFSEVFDFEAFERDQERLLIEGA
ncbi:7421_t:CDS:1, partial [Racocetra persica]